MADEKIDEINEEVKSGEENQYLSFKFNNGFYAVDILRVQEIKGWEPLTNLPLTPDFIMGSINLRGAVIPIVDMRVLLKTENQPKYDESTVVIVVRHHTKDGKEKIIGLTVDGVSDTHVIDKDDIQPPISNGSIKKEFLDGIVSIDGQMLVIFDIDTLIEKAILSI